MSRHTICGREPHVKIVLGWDPPLSTYFVQVWDGRKDGEGSLLRWTGCMPCEVPSVEDLAESLTDYVTLDAGLREQLARDREHEPGRWTDSRK